MKIIVSGLATEYTDEGEGPALLFLPGWMNTLHTFDELALLLASKYRIIRLDFPGFGGGTEFPPLDWHVGDYASFVRNFTAKIGLTSYVLVGHSFGGRVAIKGVAQGILRPSRLILVASAGVAMHRTSRNRFLTLIAKVGKGLMHIPPFFIWRGYLRKKLYERLGSDYLAAGALSRIYLNTIKEDLTEYARKISIPTLLIWGSEDNMTPLKDGKLFAELIPDSKIEIFTGIGHSPHRDCPHEVSRLITEFLA